MLICIIVHTIEQYLNIRGVVSSCWSFISNVLLFMLHHSSAASSWQQKGVLNLLFLKRKSSVYKTYCSRLLLVERTQSCIVMSPTASTSTFTHMEIINITLFRFWDRDSKSLQVFWPDAACCRAVGLTAELLRSVTYRFTIMIHS